jgi:hypothetical protein
VDIYAGRHDRPPTGSSQLDDFSAFLRIIEDDCHTGHKPFIIADDGVSRFIADPAQRDQSGLGEPAISYVTKGIKLLNTGTECLHTGTAAAAAQASQEPFKSFCPTYAAIVEKLFSLPKVQGQGINFLWTGERVGLAYDAAELFIDAENNYQGSHPAIDRAEIPGQFIADSYQGVTGLIGFTASQHIASLPLAIGGQFEDGNLTSAGCYVQVYVFPYARWVWSGRSRPPTSSSPGQARLSGPMLRPGTCWTR